MATEPLINGEAHSFARVELTVNTPTGSRTFRGVKEITYDDKVERGAMRGTHPQKLGRTLGDYNPDNVSVTLYKHVWLELLPLLTQNDTVGFGETPFDIVIHFAPPGLPLSTDTIAGCLVVGLGSSHSQGSDALVQKLDLDPMYILHDDQPMISNLLP